MAKSPPFAWYDSKKPVIKYALKFGTLMLLFYAVSVMPFCERVFWPLNLQANAWMANGILNGLRQHTQLIGDTIRTESYAFVVKRGCDATEQAWLFVAAVVAFPVSWRRKVTGVLLGTLLLLILNQARIVALFFVGRGYPEMYDSMHLTLFPAMFVVMAMMLWVAWMRWTSVPERSNTDAQI
jgi:exosortase H (IPTLxxWG-CTERM-specific)